MPETLEQKLDRAKNVSRKLNTVISRRKNSPFLYRSNTLASMAREIRMLEEYLTSNIETASLEALVEFDEKTKRYDALVKDYEKVRLIKLAYVNLKNRRDATDRSIVHLSENIKQRRSEQIILEGYTAGRIPPHKILEACASKELFTPELTALVAELRKATPVPPVQGVSASPEIAVYNDHERGENVCIIPELTLLSKTQYDFFTALSSFPRCMAVYTPAQVEEQQKLFSRLDVTPEAIREINTLLKGTPLYVLAKYTDSGSRISIKLVYSEGNGKPFRDIEKIRVGDPSAVPHQAPSYDTHTFRVVVQHCDPLEVTTNALSKEARAERARIASAGLPVERFSVCGHTFAIGATKEMKDLLLLLPAGTQYITNTLQDRNSELRKLRPHELLGYVEKIKNKINTEFENLKINLEFVRHGTLYHLVTVDRSVPAKERQQETLVKKKPVEVAVDSWTPVLPIFASHIEPDVLSQSEKRLLRSEIDHMIKRTMFVGNILHPQSVIQPYQLPRAYKGIVTAPVTVEEALALMYLDEKGRTFELGKRNAVLELIKLIVLEYRTFNS